MFFTWNGSRHRRTGVGVKADEVDDARSSISAFVRGAAREPAANARETMADVNFMVVVLLIERWLQQANDWDQSIVIDDY